MQYVFFVIFILNVEQIYLLIGLEHVLIWSKICVIQNLADTARLTKALQEAEEAVDKCYISTSSPNLSMQVLKY